MTKKPLDDREPRRDLTPMECLVLAGSAVSVAAVYGTTEAKGHMCEMISCKASQIKEMDPSISSASLGLRGDMTDLECWNIMSAAFAVLLEMAPLENVRNAVKHWADDDVRWGELQAAVRRGRQLGEQRVASGEASSLSDSLTEVVKRSRAPHSSNN